MISMGIEDILMHDESLFQNINAFDPDYVPPIIIIGTGKWKLWQWQSDRL